MLWQTYYSSESEGSISASQLSSWCLVGIQKLMFPFQTNKYISTKKPLKGDTMHFQINYLSVAGKHSDLEEVQATAGRHKLVLDVILIVRRERI